jgi:hypothetical protein
VQALEPSLEMMLLYFSGHTVKTFVFCYNE